MNYVYVLCCSKDSVFYIGYTKDLKKRLEQHSKGQSTSTKHRLPVKLIYYEAFINNADARAREEYLKSGYGRAQLKSVLKNFLKYS